MTISARTPGGAFSGEICKVPWPGLAPVASITPSAMQGQGGFSPV
jgi:hypothetical protein